MARTAVISGGARGIGRALVRRFLEKGYKVFILDIDEAELIHTTQTHLKNYSDSCALGSATCNLQDIEDIRKKAKQAAEFLGGKIDVLINNAGISYPYWKSNKTIFDLSTITEWNAYIATNLTAPFALSQSCLPHMMPPPTPSSSSTPSPTIINIGSFRAYQSDPNQEAYAATKSGLVGLTHSLAMTLRPHGIRVNLVAPGKIPAGHESRVGDERGREEEMDWEAGRPEDVVHAVEFLVGAGFVTGQDVLVDGGATRMKRGSG